MLGPRTIIMSTQYRQYLQTDLRSIQPQLQLVKLLIRPESQSESICINTAARRRGIGDILLTYTQRSIRDCHKPCASFLIASIRPVVASLLYSIISYPTNSTSSSHDSILPYRASQPASSHTQSALHPTHHPSSSRCDIVSPPASPSFP